MLESIKLRTSKKSVELAITDTLQKKKAYNHNVGETIPKRSFLPDDSKKSGKNSGFTKEIMDGVRRIIQDAEDKIP